MSNWVSRRVLKEGERERERERERNKVQTEREAGTNTGLILQLQGLSSLRPSYSSLQEPVEGRS